MSSHASWLILVLVVIFGTALLGRRRAGRPPTREQPPEPEPTRPPIQPLRPGESYDTSVKLVTVPNVPMAELWCQRLREEGIEAFYKSGLSSPFMATLGGAAANPALSTEVWVGEHDLKRARELFPELA